ncbi:hypothetical protein RRG08_023368 [Elysia crispata]|uniref:Uncharacterized protein n=1 Tax=Elysia crispata TaxID=231223 RepID=A0AAE1EFI6_9GAST|nr:hypothetical protein RRG08_023368 [Elysia crispata]
MLASFSTSGHLAQRLVEASLQRLSDSLRTPEGASKLHKPLHASSGSGEALHGGRYTLVLAAVNSPANQVDPSTSSSTNTDSLVLSSTRVGTHQLLNDSIDLAFKMLTQHVQTCDRWKQCTRNFHHRISRPGALLFLVRAVRKSVVVASGDFVETWRTTEDVKEIQSLNKT